MADRIYWFAIRVKYLFFRIFQARLRSIWIMDVVGREGWMGDKRVDDPNMIGVYCAMIKQCHWSDLPHCWNGMIRWSAQNIYSRIGTLAEWKDVFGGTRWVFVTKQNIGQHVKSFKIDDYKQCNEWITKGWWWEDKRKCIFHFWTMTGEDEPRKYSVSVMGGGVGWTWKVGLGDV